MADSLGIPKDMLYRWRRELASQANMAFPGRGNEALTDEQRELRELRKRLQDAEMERDIKKKPWASSAEHRNKIPVRTDKPLYISGEEDVPYIASFHERFSWLA